MSLEHDPIPEQMAILRFEFTAALFEVLKRHLKQATFGLWGSAMKFSR